MSGWRPALRIARREAWRARKRSALVVVMIALPVFAVVGLDVLARTADVSSVEGLDRRLGSADALLTYDGTPMPIVQDPLGQSWGSEWDERAEPRPLTEQDLRSVLGPDVRAVELREGQVSVVTAAGFARPAAFELDLHDPMTDGLYVLRDGRLPAGSGEVAVSPRLSARGLTVGTDLVLDGGGTRRIVGILQPAGSREANAVVALPGALDVTDPADRLQRWLVDAPGGVSWANVRELNAIGVHALSRQVVLNPPPASEVPMESGGGGAGSAELAVLGMVVAMALLQVVLLAGPAFAVGARRQERSLALVAATGGEPRHVRRIVLASGVVLGAAAAGLGAATGIAGAWAFRPLFQRLDDQVFGPFEVPWLDVAAIAACGVLSAVAAAFAPAWSASRQDVVAVLAGRRGRLRRLVWSPVLGVVLLVVGIVGAVLGTGDSGSEWKITGSAVLAILGMVLLSPFVVGHLGGVAGLFPLAARFAVRDAARQRARTAPAVAAVAATVAGTVALAIGGSSDAAESKALWSPMGPMGAGVVQVWNSSPEDWPRIEDGIHRQLPQARVRSVSGVRDEMVDDGYGGYPHTPVEVAPLTMPDADEGDFVSYSYANAFGTAYLVGEDALLALDLDVSGTELSRARRALAAGGVVLLSVTPDPATEADVRKFAAPRPGTYEPRLTGEWRVPAAVITVPGTTTPARAVLSEEVVRTTQVEVGTTALLVDGTTIGTAEQDVLDEVVARVTPDGSVYVERGYQDGDTALVLWLLGAVGGLLVLGGTLTASFLALSDARPDFATLSAVGASPRLRRLVAGAYAATIGLVGAVLGAAVGFVPGVAIAYPLTGRNWAPSGATDASGVPLPDVFIDIPWTLLTALVLGVPLLAAAVVMAVTKSRLPMVARLH